MTVEQVAVEQVAAERVVTEPRGRPVDSLFVVRASMRANDGIDVDDPATVPRHADTVIHLVRHGLLLSADER